MKRTIIAGLLAAAAGGAHAAEFRPLAKAKGAFTGNAHSKGLGLTFSYAFR